MLVTTLLNLETRANYVFSGFLKRMCGYFLKNLFKNPSQTPQSSIEGMFDVICLGINVNSEETVFHFLFLRACVKIRLN